MKVLLLDSAAQLAYRYHTNQIRKGDGTPYFIHLVMVAQILTRHAFDDETVAAGFCHDLLEDTPCTEDEIRTVCGERVLEYVKIVSHDPVLNTDEKAHWEKIRELYIESVRSGPDEAKGVCIADKIHNLTMLSAAVERDGEVVWTRFNRGKEKKAWFEQKLLAELQKVWDHPILDEYEELIRRVYT
jgi:(p)ppGpp synthase/HD superfamily hydrolase